MKTWIGVDNGVTGSIGVIDTNGVCYIVKTPTKKTLNYTKKKAFFTRIDFDDFYDVFNGLRESCNSFCLIERPMVMPGRWKATVSALRAFESTMIAIEQTNIPYQFIDSKEWQKVLLPSGLNGKELKIAAIQVAKRLFPKLEIPKGCDADGILIAEYCKRIKQ